MKLNFKSNIDFRYSGVVSLVVLLFGSLIAFVLVPFIINTIVKKMTILTPGSLFRRQQENTTFIVKIYLLNMTNPDEVVAGGIPRFQETGPFVYDAYKIRVNQTDDEAADTLTYDLKHLFYYRPDLSVADEATQKVCSINALMASGLAKTLIEMPEFITFAKTGIDLIFGSPDTPIVCYNPLDVLHLGYYVNCDQTEFAAKAICSALAAQPYFRKINGSEKHLELGAFFKANNTIENRYTILRGKKNHNDVGRIVAVNGNPLMDYYEYEKCNIINGTDAISFPPKQKKESVSWFYFSELCTSFPLEYTGKKRVHGIKTHLKEMIWNSSLFDQDCNFNEYLGHGFRGSIDIHDCQEGFAYISGPHNYLADPKFSENILGLAPDKKKHVSEFYFDPLTGKPLRIHFRYQLSLLVKPVAEYPIMSKVKEFRMPTTWFELSLEASSEVIGRLRAIHLGKSIGNIIGRFAFFIGVIGCMLSIVALALGIGPDTPKILNVVPNSGEVPRTPNGTQGSASTTATD